MLCQYMIAVESYDDFTVGPPDPHRVHVLCKDYDALLVAKAAAEVRLPSNGKNAVDLNDVTAVALTAEMT